ncbi:hypothetical protein [Thermotoga neapolitana]|uniref:hypothetical protein n=1 Tax=Thermotoga neapolitana TaxID=2337 RepID=UPI0012E022EB|nr:hypothetical protein [Thermotoga neapolitana]
MRTNAMLLIKRSIVMRSGAIQRTTLAIRFSTRITQSTKPFLSFERIPEKPSSKKKKAK